MNVCFLTTARSPFSPILLAKEAASLRATGHQVTIIAPLAAGESATDPRAARLGLRIVPLDRMSESRRRKLLTLPKLLKLALREPCDVYQALEPQCLLVGAIAKLLRRRALIYDSREHYPLALAVNTGLGPRLTRLLKAFFTLFEATLVVLFADHVFAVDQGCLERFQRLHFGKPVSLLTNYPRRDFGDHESPARPAPPTPGDAFHFVYTGFTRRRNAVFESIRAVALLRERGFNVKVTFTGMNGDPDYLSECRALAARLQVADAVSLLGYVQQEEIAELLTGADCGSLLYYATPYTAYATHPVKLFEYMAFSLPVICSSLPNMSQMVLRERCGLVVDPRNPESIAEALAQLIQHPEMAAQFGANGRRAFLDHYNWEALEPSYLAVYQRLRYERSRQRNTTSAEVMDMPRARSRYSTEPDEREQEGRNHRGNARPIGERGG